MKHFCLLAAAALSTTAAFGELNQQQYDLFVQEYSTNSEKEVPQAILETIVKKMDEKDFKAHPEIRYYVQKLLKNNHYNRNHPSSEEMIAENIQLLESYIGIYKEIAADKTNPLCEFAKFELSYFIPLLKCHQRKYSSKDELHLATIKAVENARENYLRKLFNTDAEGNELYGLIYRRAKVSTIAKAKLLEYATLRNPKLIHRLPYLRVDSMSYCYNSIQVDLCDTSKLATEYPDEKSDLEEALRYLTSMEPRTETYYL